MTIAYFRAYLSIFKFFKFDLLFWMRVDAPARTAYHRTTGQNDVYGLHLLNSPLTFLTKSGSKCHPCPRRKAKKSFYPGGVHACHRSILRRLYAPLLPIRGAGYGVTH